MAYLHDADHVGQSSSIDIDWAEEHEQLMRRRIRHELQVIGRVLVVRCNEERDHALQERLGGRVV